MKKNEYNWWTDPENEDLVKRISWWDHDENKTTFPFPMSVIKSGERWVASVNDESKKLIGDGLGQVAEGDTKEDAIKMVFKLMDFHYRYLDDCRLKYQRWVPFRKGQWSRMGGRWFTIFGIHVSFRRGKNMKGGWYIPFTKLNISMSNEWTLYQKFKIKE